jgi:hypothetical protein
MIKNCSYCHIDKDVIEFSPNSGTRDKLASHCRACHRVHNANYRKNNLERVNISNRRYRAANKDKHRILNRAHDRKLREIAIAAYGGACACCGESTYEFLAIDHIDGGGNAQRRALGSKGGGAKFCRILKKQNWPVGFRVLCHNCNMADGFYGCCPHRRLLRVVGNGD